MYLFQYIYIYITRDIPKTFKANQSYPPIGTRYHKSRTRYHDRLPSSGFPTFILIFYIFLLQNHPATSVGCHRVASRQPPPDLAAPQSSELCPLWSSHGRRPRGFFTEMWMPLGYQWFLFWETLQDGMTICIIYIVYIYIYGIAKKVWRKFDRWWIAKSLDCCRIIELLHVWSQFLEGK